MTASASIVTIAILNAAIALDEEESEVAPQNPNVRGAHGGGEEFLPLDEIIRTFNEHWFSGRAATPEEERVKFISILQEVMQKRRKEEMELYRLFTGEDSFKRSLTRCLKEAEAVMV